MKLPFRPFRWARHLSNPRFSAHDEASGCAARARQTLRLEIRRVLLFGVLEACAPIFLLIAVQLFHAPGWQKSLIAAASSLGFLFAPAVVYFASRWRITAGNGLRYLAAIGAFGMFLPVLVPGAAAFVAGVLIAGASAASFVPLVTQIHNDHYPASARGKLFSATASLRLISTAVCSYAAGVLLTDRLDLYPLILVCCGLSLVAIVPLACRYPAALVPRSDTDKLWTGFHALRRDVLFRQTIVSWMFLGTGNLMMLPLRVEYLGNPRYGLDLDPNQIVLLVAVLPTIARFFALPIFGYFFDRVDFFLMRLVANACFIAYTLAFFLTDSYTGLVAGAVILGLSHGGGEVAWSLWVTKIAPEGKVASYMAVHSFFTGVRGVLAPFLGFFLIERYSIAALAELHVALILVSMLVLVPHLGKDVKARDRRAELRKKKLAATEAPEALDL